MNKITQRWQSELSVVYKFYGRHRPKLKLFFPTLFLFFIVLNISCYWWGIFTAFPEAAFGKERFFYFKVQFPVGVLGALFDSLSFFVTIFIIRRSLKATSSLSFVGHLSVDLAIAVLATFWVVFVFSFSGWLISLTEPVKEVLSVRNEVYKSRVISAVTAPGRNLKNIYFGLVMGVSAMLPTCLHIGLALTAVYKSLIARIQFGKLRRPLQTRTPSK